MVFWNPVSRGHFLERFRWKCPKWWMPFAALMAEAKKLRKSRTPPTTSKWLRGCSETERHCIDGVDQDHLWVEGYGYTRIWDDRYGPRNLLKSLLLGHLQAHSVVNCPCWSCVRFWPPQVLLQCVLRSPWTPYTPARSPQWDTKTRRLCSHRAPLLGALTWFPESQLSHGRTGVRI